MLRFRRRKLYLNKNPATFFEGGDWAGTCCWATWFSLLPQFPMPTSWKINMVHLQITPFGKENDLNQPSREWCSMLIFRGVTICQFSSPINPLDFTNWLIYICMVFFQRICHLVSGGNNSWNSKRKITTGSLSILDHCLGGSWKFCVVQKVAFEKIHQLGTLQTSNPVA